MAEFTIEVAYALPAQQILISVRVSDGATIHDVLQLEEVTTLIPAAESADCNVGVWGRVVEKDQPVKSGDRVEIYRPLLMDPREARRQLAASGLTMRDVHDG